jgi:Zn-dependent protease with chaperone function
MQFTYGLTQGEFIEYLEVIRPVRSFRRDLKLFSLLAAALCLILAYGTGRSSRLAFIFVAVFIVVFSFLVFFFSSAVAKRMFRNNALFSAEKTVKFNSEGVISDTKFQHVEVKWSSFYPRLRNQGIVRAFHVAKCRLPHPQAHFHRGAAARIPGSPRPKSPICAC